jgi:hypothetical protein
MALGPTLNFEDLEAPLSEKDDAPSQENDNPEHATVIVMELAATDTDVSKKLQKMVEDRFDQEQKKQVVVEAVQAVPMGNDEEGDNVCGVTTRRKCGLFLVDDLHVIVAAVGAGIAVGASSGNVSSDGSENGSSNNYAPLSGTTAAPAMSGLEEATQRHHQIQGLERPELLRR